MNSTITVPSEEIDDTLALIGERLVDFQLLARGATSSVWLIRSDQRRLVLRLVEAENRVIGEQIDHFIRQAVSDAGGRVAIPLTNSDAIGRLIGGRRWSLDEFVSGQHPERGRLSGETCAGLGETLAALHAIPVSGVGKPVRIEEDTIIGDRTNPVDGIAQRFEMPLPEYWPDGYVNPLLRAAPDIESSVLEHLRQVAIRSKQANSVLCHSDLHEGQLICREGLLAALIDFGDATLLDRHWDFGSLLYFHGTQVFEAAYSAYCGLANDEIDTDLALSFAIAIAMHHANRSLQPGKAHRLAFALNVVRGLLK